MWAVGGCSQPGNSGAGGQITYGPGLVNYSVNNFPPVNWFVPGSTFGFQTWYRDPSGPCGQLTNISSAVGPFAIDTGFVRATGDLTTALVVALIVAGVDYHHLQRMESG